MPRIKKIVPRWWKDRGWYLCRPLDFRSPSSPKRFCYFGKDNEALSAATAEAKRMTDARKSHGAPFLMLPIWQQNELLRMGERIGWENCKAAADLFEERKPLSQLGIPQIAADCIAEKLAKGKLRKNSAATLKWTFDSFADYCKKSIGSITEKDINAWLDFHTEWASITQHRRIGDMSTLFKFAKQKRIVIENPCDFIIRPTVILKEPKIYAVGDLEQVLHACQQHDPALLGWLATVLFGGLRVTESQRMDADDMTDEVIALETGDKTKLNNRRAFEIQPVLKAWMEVPGVEIQKLSAKRLYKRLHRIFEFAQVKFLKNALRKSCASYWVKLVGSKEASRILGHSETMLHKNYANNKVTMADAQRFEALRPIKI